MHVPPVLQRTRALSRRRIHAERAAANRPKGRARLSFHPVHSTPPYPTYPTGREAERAEIEVVDRSGSQQATCTLALSFTSEDAFLGSSAVSDTRGRVPRIPLGIPLRR